MLELIIIMEVLKILLVDDEPEARELLTYMLKPISWIRVVGDAGTVDEAMKLAVS